VIRVACISRGYNLAERNLARSWTTLVIVRSNVLKHEQISTLRTDVGDFRQPARSKLPLPRKVVLLVHLIRSIRIVEEDETTSRGRRDTGAWRRNYKGRRRNTVIKR